MAANTNKNWAELVNNSATNWKHVICKITDKPPNRRSFVLWFCSNHPSTGSCIFQKDEPKLIKFKNQFLLDNRKGLSLEEIDELILQYPEQRFYATRMDLYLNPGKDQKERNFCCQAGMFLERKQEGLIIFENLLAERGKHYKTKYKLLEKPSTYEGKYHKYCFICEAHNQILCYSMQDLNFNTSCPCPECRKDPNHKNVCVDIIKKRNAGREGQVVRHAKRVKTKYNNTCALSNSTFDLQHHHLDGHDFYEETALNWNANGICLCGTIHRDYHNNFLKNHSVIAEEYAGYTFNPDSDFPESLENQSAIDLSNPDYLPNGVEVSRYTFLEYLRFLIFDINSRKSTYVNTLNNKIKADYSSKKRSPTDFCGEITLEGLKKAMTNYCSEYKGNNWALASQTDIPFANDVQLWAKVDNTWA